MKTLGKVIDAKEVEFIDYKNKENVKIKIRGDGFVEILEGKKLSILPENQIVQIIVF